MQNKDSSALNISQMKKNIWIIAIVLLWACGPQNTESEDAKEEAETPSESVETTGDNTQVSVDWDGTYKGTIPCADCEGIETTLTLNKDQTYLLKSSYLGRNDALEQEMSGTFEWDESGSKVTLMHMDKIEGQYKIGENQAWFLDRSGDIITGDLADLYILKKQ